MALFVAQPWILGPMNMWPDDFAGYFRPGLVVVALVVTNFLLCIVSMIVLVILVN